MGRKLKRINSALHSPQGRNVLTFCAFIAISAVLWVVQVLNEETQRDLRCAIRITNVPDSVTRVSPIPEAINVSVRSRGTQLLKYLWSSTPTMTIDYRVYKSGNRIVFGDASLKAFFRTRIGGGAQIMSVTPDSLSIYFTSHPGIELPVKVDANVMPGPQYAIIGKVRPLVDSVMVYSVNNIPAGLRSITTSHIVLNDVRSSRTLRVPLIAPPGTRVIPDSVDVRIEVEALIAKTRRVPVTTVNVPHGVKLITVPAQVEVYYMVPMSIYKRSESNPRFTVEADYNSIIANPGCEKVAVNLTSAPKDFVNVFLAADSVDYIIEQ